MKSFVIDTSVAVKWFVPEEYSNQAILLLEAEYDLLAPDLIFAEVGNTLWKKVQREEITSTIAQEILQTLLSFPLHIYETRHLLESAFNIAHTTQRTVYDSIYLALANTFECELVTADKKFFNALKDGSFSNNILWIENIYATTLSQKT
ncbi:type II toxin-antitoxin system VapC family toxin [soil metagenome]